MTIYPPSLSLRHGDSWSFTATVSPADTPLIWKVQEGSSGGSVNDAGFYIAPAAEGVYHVIATSQSDPSKSATATVNVGNSGFNLTGNLGHARNGHTATLLPNGKVYIAGGGIDSTDPNIEDGVTIVDTDELFDLTTGISQAAGEVARAFHTATVLQNGDVLFTGGIVDDTEAQGLILTETAEILNGISGSLQPTGSMALARYYHTATRLQDGRVLITGGWARSATDFTVTNSAEIYDPSSGSFSRVGDMAAARDRPSATLLASGKVLVTGGGVAAAELFDPATNSFTPAGSTASRWVGDATLLADGRVLVSGEADSDLSSPIATELYDPTTGKFTPTGTMATVRFGYTSTQLPDGTVLIAGGAMPVPASPGTYSQSPLSTTEIYNPKTGTFSPGPIMRQARFGHTATLLPDGSIFIAGGRGEGGHLREHGTVSLRVVCD